MTQTAKKARTTARTKPLDALALLTADHQRVEDLFKRFSKLKSRDDADDDKGELAQQVCSALKVHMQIEEDIFYPVARDALNDDDLLDEAEVEHASAKELMDQIEAMMPGDDQYDAKVTVLGEQIKHHVKEEETSMFPKVRKAKVDIAALGAEMLERRAELMDEMGLHEERQTPRVAQGSHAARPTLGIPRARPSSKSNSTYSRT